MLGLWFFLEALKSSGVLQFWNSHIKCFCISCYNFYLLFDIPGHGTVMIQGRASLYATPKLCGCCSPIYSLKVVISFVYVLCNCLRTYIITCKKHSASYYCEVMPLPLLLPVLYYKYAVWYSKGVGGWQGGWTPS